jgi:hypothetical protein
METQYRKSAFFESRGRIWARRPILARRLKAAYVRPGRAFPPPALEWNGPRAPETIKMGIAPPFSAGRHSGITIILSAGRRSTGPTSTAPSRLAAKPAQLRRNSYDISYKMQDGSRVAQELIGPAGIRCVVGRAGYRANPHHEVDLRTCRLPAAAPLTA